MVVSKRCKICSVIDADNALITGEYYGKKIPDIILRICGVEVDPRKAREVLLCQTCIIQLVYTDAVIEKLRNAVLRLKTNVRQPKLKNPSTKKILESFEKHTEFLNGKTFSDTSAYNGPGDIAKKAARRKSARPDDKVTEIENGTNKTDTISIPGTPILKTAAKRKSKSSNARTINSFLLDDAHEYSKSEKRVRTLSKCEEPNMDLSVDEQESNETRNEACTDSIEESPRNCILCGKVFHSKRTLRDHIETAHMGERLKACPHCSSEFRTQQKYESHVFSEKCKNSNHACQFLNCNKRFKTLHKMELHMQHKHSRNEL